MTFGDNYEESASDSDTVNDKDYVELSQVQQKEYASLLSFVGKRFEDIDDKDNSFEGIVTDVLMFESTPCFAYEVLGAVAKSQVDSTKWEHSKKDYLNDRMQKQDKTPWKVMRCFRKER